MHNLLTGCFLPLAGAALAAAVWSMLLADMFLVAARAGRLSRLLLIAAMAMPAYVLAVVCVMKGQTSLLLGAVLGAIPYLLLLLPAVYLVKHKPNICEHRPVMTICFLLAACLVLICSATGFDRQLEPLEGQFLLTLLIIMIWYVHSGRKLTAEHSAGHSTWQKPTKIVFKSLSALAMIPLVYILLTIACGRLTQLAEKAKFDDQLLAAMALGAVIACGMLAMIWATANISDFVRCMCSYNLILLVLIGSVAIFLGPIRFSVPLWRVEAFSGLVGGLMWLGLLRPENRLGRTEAGAVAGFFVLYLLVRLLTMVNAIP